MHHLAKRWPLVLLRALASLVFGFFALTWPAMTLSVLLLFFAAYSGVDGVLAFGASFAAAREHRLWIGLLLRGVLGVAVALAVLFWPAMSALVLVYFIAMWAILAGFFEIVAGVQAHRLTSELWLILGGAISVVFGLVAWFHPGVGALGIVWFIGAYAIMYAITLGTFALRLRPFARHPDALRHS